LHDPAALGSRAPVVMTRTPGFVRVLCWPDRGCGVIYYQRVIRGTRVRFSCNTNDWNEAAV
ncbi:MAG: hypothetical protein ACYTF8_07895, partial [Planctomycetota bacterium]